MLGRDRELQVPEGRAEVRGGRTQAGRIARRQAGSVLRAGTVALRRAHLPVPAQGQGAACARRLAATPGIRWRRTRTRTTRKPSQSGRCRSSSAGPTGGWGRSTSSSTLPSSSPRRSSSASRRLACSPCTRTSQPRGSGRSPRLPRYAWRSARRSCSGAARSGFGRSSTGWRATADAHQAWHAAVEVPRELTLRVGWQPFLLIGVPVSIFATIEADLRAIRDPHHLRGHGRGSGLRRRPALLLIRAIPAPGCARTSPMSFHLTSAERRWVCRCAGSCSPRCR